MQEDLTKEAIEKNIRTLKTQLNGSSLHFADELSAALDGIESKLSWEMPLASGVLYSQSKEIEELGSNASFMEPMKTGRYQLLLLWQSCVINL